MRYLELLLLGALSAGCGALGSDDNDDSPSTSPTVATPAAVPTSSSANENSNYSQDSRQSIEDALLDSDGDGLTDVLERYFGSNPNDPDTDDDGVDDLAEYSEGLDPNNGDSDGDSIPEALDLTPGSYTLKAIVDFEGDRYDGCYKKSTFRGSINDSTSTISANDSYNVYYNYSSKTGLDSYSNLRLLIYSSSSSSWRLVSSEKADGLQTHPNDFRLGHVLDYGYKTSVSDPSFGGITTVEESISPDGAAITYAAKVCFYSGDAINPWISDHMQFIELNTKVAISSGSLEPNDSYHAFAAYDGGEYYLIAYSLDEAKWVIMNTMMDDPASLTGQLLEPSLVEDIGAASKTLNGGFAPDNAFIEY